MPDENMEICAGQGAETCQVLCREESIREYLKLVNFERTIQTIVESSQNNLITEDTPKKLVEIVRSCTDYKELTEVVVRIYRETYDQQTIDALICFYQSEVGQKFLSHQEDLAIKLLKASQQVSLNMVARIAKKLEELEEV